MQVFFLCHGDAEVPLFKTPRADFERTLSEHGVKTTMDEAKGLKLFTPGFDVIFTSPITRAAQTATIFAEIFNCHEVARKLDALAPPGDLESLLEAIALSGDLERVLCVGHSPSLEIMATEIITGLEEERLFPLRAGGLLCFRLEKPEMNAEAEIEYLMDPGILAKLGELSQVCGEKDYTENAGEDEFDDYEEVRENRYSRYRRNRKMNQHMDFKQNDEMESDFLV